MKKLAISSLKEFISLSKTKSNSEQRKIAEEISSLCFWNPNIHQLSAHPLVEYIKSVLDHWTHDEPKNATPLRWLGYMGADVSYYEAALKIDSTDEICLSRVAQAYLNDIDYQTHHLSESLFLGNLDDAIKYLDAAESLINKIKTEKTKSSMLEDLAYYSNLLSCWEEYSSQNMELSFPNWCASKGEEFNFWSIVYYDQK